MIDTTQPRRDLLSALLDRAEDGTLTTTEADLLRPLVAAEQDAADAWRLDIDARRERVAAALTAEHYRRARERIVASPEEHSLALAGVAIAALDGPSPDDEQGAADAGRRYWRGSDGIDIGHAYMTAQAALARVRAYTNQLAADPHPGHDHVCPDDVVRELRAALDGEQPAEPAPDGDGTWALATCRRVLSRTCPPSGPCPGPCARFESDDPAAWEQPKPARDSVKRVGSPFPMPDGATDIYGPVPATWHGNIDGYRTGTVTGVLAHSQAPGTLARCAPFQHPDCPGHLNPPYCGDTTDAPSEQQ